MHTVHPLLIAYGNKDSVRPQWDCFGFYTNLAMLLSYGFYPVTLSVLPPFKPNEYLAKTHADKGRNEVEVFSWAVRDVMSKFGDLKKVECPIQHKALYKKFITGKIDEIEIDGKVFTAPPMKKKK